MPTYDPDLAGALRSLQRQIDQINTARPGPMSWGPDDGQIRFYGTDGRVLFEASSAGAQVESRGTLTGLTGLVDGIRGTNDAQNGRLNDHHDWISGLGSRMTATEATDAAQNGRLNDQHGWIGSLGTRMTAAETTNTAQNGRLNDHHDWISGLGGRMSTVESSKASASSLNATNSRVSSLESQMSGKASQSSVGNALSTARQYTDSRIQRVVDALRAAGINIAV